MADRVDENGAAYAGSQLQTQLYVNKRTEQLNAAVSGAFPELAGASFDWRSPRADDRYAEYWDAAFLKLLHLDDHTDALAKFWAPRGGPHWDALALVTLSGGDQQGVLLVEGKSYPGEMLGGPGLSAKDEGSKRAILKALAWTQGTLGIPLDTPAWTGPLYQNANRLAHLCWLRSRGVHAWLVHLLFTGDEPRATTADEWEKAVADADEALGLEAVTISAAAHVTLPAGTRDELLS